MTNKISYLDDGDLCVLTKDSVEFYDDKKKRLIKKFIIYLMTKIQVTKAIIKILCPKKFLNSP